MGRTVRYRNPIRSHILKGETPAAIMQFEPTRIDGVHLVLADLVTDDRGYFTRLYSPDEFAAAGISFAPLQTSLSHNRQKLTLRGMHYASEPEAKLVRCTRGRIFDVAVDVRPHSATFGRWCGFELDALAGRGLYIPAGVAHGFLTMDDESDVLYQIERIYRPGFDLGVRWNDPAFSISWPAEPAIIHPRDAAYPDFLTKAAP